MIKVWEFDFNSISGKDVPDYTDQKLVQEAFDSNLTLLAGLEGRGFEGVFYSEHHFLNSMSPCPKPVGRCSGRSDETAENRCDGKRFAIPSTVAPRGRAGDAGLSYPRSA